MEKRKLNKNDLRRVIITSIILAIFVALIVTFIVLFWDDIYGLIKKDEETIKKIENLLYDADFNQTAHICGFLQSEGPVPFFISEIY